MVGVDQDGVEGAGFARALAFFGARADLDDAGAFEAMAAAVLALGDAYRSLGGGAAAELPSAAALADAILGAFVRNERGLSPLDVGGPLAGSWRDVLVDAARAAFNFEVVLLADPRADGSVELVAPAANCSPSARLALIAQVGGAFYPLVATNPSLYFRTPPASRNLVVRRTFRVLDEASDQAAGRLAESVAASVLAAVASAPSPAAQFSLATADRFLRAAGLPVQCRLVNFAGFCYGLLVDTPAGTAYCPVHASPLPAHDGARTAFGPRPATPLPLAAHLALTAPLFAWLAAEQMAVRRGAPIVDDRGRPIGVASAGGAPLYFIHDAAGDAASTPAASTPAASTPAASTPAASTPAASTPAASTPAASTPAASTPAAGSLSAGDLASAIAFPYSARRVDAAIAETIRGTSGAKAADAAADATKVDTDADAAVARNQLYRLFLAEFSAVVRAERNTAVRNKIKAAVAAAKIGTAAGNQQKLRRELLAILADEPRDFELVRGVISRAFAANPRDPTPLALAGIDGTAFDFDRRTFAALKRAESHSAIVADLKRLMADRIAPADVPAPPSENVFVACSDRKSSDRKSAVCSGRRLAVPSNLVEDFFNLLAADVVNPIKIDLLTASASGVIAPLSFARYPGEVFNATFGADS
jgi:hypothetical protein